MKGLVKSASGSTMTLKREGKSIKRTTTFGTSMSAGSTIVFKEPHEWQDKEDNPTFHYTVSILLVP